MQSSRPYRHTLRRMAPLAALPALALAALVAMAAAALADQPCRPVQGFFTSVALPPDQCASPVGFCTSGKLIGGLHGGYAFVMQSSVPSGSTGVEGVYFYTGESTISAKHGGTLLGTDTGSIDLHPLGSGKMAALITLTGGTGRFAGASGYLQLRGSLDLSTGGATGDYRGEVCTP